MKPLYQRIEDEREHQRALWGDDRDDTQTPADWTHILAIRVGKLGIELQRAYGDPGSPEGVISVEQEIQRRAIQVAAVAVALIEAIDRGQKRRGWSSREVRERARRTEHLLRERRGGG